MYSLVKMVCNVVLVVVAYWVAFNTSVYAGAALAVAHVTYEVMNYLQMRAQEQAIAQFFNKLEQNEKVAQLFPKNNGNC